MVPSTKRSHVVRTRFAAILAVLTIALAAASSVRSDEDAHDISPVLDRDIVDLTHTLDEAFPFIPVPGITFPFGLEPIATIERHGVAANRWTLHEHLGTQIDAPNHFAADGRALHELPVDDLVIPAVVIDFRTQSTASPDAELRVSDIQRWERRHGRIPEGSVVMLYTGWESKLRDPEAYIGLDEEGVKHFPGIGASAARFLVEQRDIWGVGVDTVSFDPGYDDTYQTHRIVLGADKWALEAVANLRRLPPVGAIVFIGAPKVRDATGGPVRIVAFVPEPPSLHGNLDGRWRSTAAEPVERADGSVIYLQRDFRFDGDRWSIDFTVSVDAEGEQPLLSGHNAGRFSIGVYRALDRSFEAYFGFERRTLTPRAPAIAEALNGAGCGSTRWTVGEEQDVTEQGCPEFRVLERTRCPGEYDLVRWTAEGLFLGARPADGDLCATERRPQRPGPHLLVRAGS